MKPHTVLARLRHNGRLYVPGDTVDLTENEAAVLLPSGVVTPPAPAPAVQPAPESTPESTPNPAPAAQPPAGGRGRRPRKNAEGK